MFKEIKNEAQSSQAKENRRVRDDFHKKIRKEVLENKIAQMRKTLFINKTDQKEQKSANQEENTFFEQFQQRYGKQFQRQSGQEEKQRMQTIRKSLHILGKFNNLGLQTVGSSEMKKFSKKIDAIICLVMSIDEWITDDLARSDIEIQMNQKEQIQIEENDEKEQIDFGRQQGSEIFDNLQPMKWTQKNVHESRLQLLKQIAHLVLVQKIELFIDVIQSRYESLKQLPNPQLISSTLLRWLYFYQDNMQIFYYQSGNQSLQTLNDHNEDPFWETFTISYFDIAFRIIKLLSLNCLVETFFNPILQNIPNFQQNLNDQSPKQLLNSYITCSPFQYLIQNDGEGQRLLRELQVRIKFKIDQKEKQLFIQRMRNISLEVIKDQDIKKVNEEQLQFQKAKKLLAVLSARLEIQQIKNLKQTYSR